MLETQPLKDGVVRSGSPGWIGVGGGGPLVSSMKSALCSRSRALEGIDLNDLHVYGGVSVGAINAAALANGFTPAKICRIFVRNESLAFPLDPEHFMRPAFGLYWACLNRCPVCYGMLMEFHQKSPGSGYSGGVE